MIVIGLDPGTHLGWAVNRDGMIVASGTKDLSPWAAKGYGAMFGAFRRWLNDLRVEHCRTTIHERGEALRAVTERLGALAYELPFHRGAITSRITGGLAAHAQERAHAWRAKVLPVQTMTLKKFATGSGKAGKLDMIEIARRFVPAQNDLGTGRALTEHEADAIHVARWGWEELKKGSR